MIPALRILLAVLVPAPVLAAGGSGEGSGPFETLGAEAARRAAARAAPLQRPGARERGEAWSVTYDNESLGWLHENTARGWSVAWLSDDVDTYADGSWAKAFRDLGSSLGWVGDKDVVDRVSFRVGQELFGPPDLSLSNPPRTQPPYAGVLFVDGTIHTRDVRESHTWVFRLGLTGPPALGEEGQELLQGLGGGDDPEGWDEQIHTELVANATYEYRYRGVEGELGRSQYDLSPVFGAAAGTYAVYVNGGADLRIGRHLPEQYGATSFRTGGRTYVVDVPQPGSGLAAHGFVSARAWGVAKYLPLDGNTFKDSRSVDTEDFVGSIAAGFSLATGGAVLRYTLGWFTGQWEGQPSGESRYGTLSLSWSR